MYIRNISNILLDFFVCVYSCECDINEQEVSLKHFDFIGVFFFLNKTLAHSFFSWFFFLFERLEKHTDIATEHH